MSQERKYSLFSPSPSRRFSPGYHVARRPPSSLLLFGGRDCGAASWRAVLLCLIAVLLAGLAGDAAALTNYVGGSDPGGGADWLSGTWENFTNQLADLASEGDELRIAGTITRDSGTAYVTSSVAGVKITGGWDGSTWTRKDLSDTNNLSVIDGALLGGLLRIRGSDTLLEGVWLKRAINTGAGQVSTALAVLANGVTVDYCCFTDSSAGTSGSGQGAALYVCATNVTVRRSLFCNNSGALASAGSATCHLFVQKSDNIHITECVFTKTMDGSASYFSISLLPDANKTLTLDNCLIYDNEKTFYMGDGTNMLINTTIHDTPVKFYDFSTVQTFVKNCIIDNCGYSFSDGGGSGGDVFFENSFVTNLAWLKTQPFTNAAGVVQTTVHWDEDAGNPCLEIDEDTPAGFTDPDNGDFTLQAGSLAIDLGDDAYLSDTYQGNEEDKSSSEQTDLAVNSRVLVDCVDAGAYEYEPPATGSGTMIFFQ